MKVKLDLKIFIFIGIFIVTKQIQIYALLMLFAIIHEIGHILVGLVLKFKIDTLQIMPYGISVSFKSDYINYNKKVKRGNLLAIKKLIIALGGPITNLIIAIIFLIFPITFFGIDRQYVIYSNILIFIFNLLPIYPLDGGRIIKNILHILYGIRDSYEYTNKISNITVGLLTAFCSILILYMRNISIVIILAYLWYLVISENRKYKNKMLLYEKIDQFRDVSF